MTRINKIELRNKSLYVSNFVIGAAIFFICTTSAIPTRAVLYVASFHIFGYEAMSQITSKLPEFMQFFEVGGMERGIHSGFYFAIACTIIAAILIGCALYQMNKNSKEIGENNCELRIINALKPKISYLHGKGTPEDPIYVTLREKYPNGCEVKSKTGNKTLILGKMVEGQNNDYEYEVIEYKNAKKPEITKEGSQKDFFNKGKDSRDDVTISGDILFHPHELTDLIVNILHPQEQQPKERQEVLQNRASI